MQNDAGTVAYIIVSWNNKTILDDCIDSINQQDYADKKIILVDNDSSDGTVQYIKEKFPSVLVLPQEANLGFAKGNNIGIMKALEDSGVTHVMLLNSDARLAKNWTSTILRTALLKPRAATLQSITLDYYSHSIIDSSHIYISRMGQAIQGSYKEIISDNFDAAPQKVFGCNAAAMLITRAFIEAQPFQDFFDETMFMYLEDVDVAARATIMGWDNYIVPGTRAYHMGSVSAKKKDPSYSLYMTFRNNTGLLVKNLPTRTLLHILFRLWRADIASIRHLRRVGQGNAVPALIKGRLAGLRLIPVFWHKRRTLKKFADVDSEYLWLLMRHGY
jgi:GT2 family glycosyltransferase